MPLTRARLVYDNIALTSTITASASVADRPVSYLASPARWKKWRSTTTTGNQNVDFVFSSQSVQCVALVDWKRHGTAGTITAQYWNGASYVTFSAFTLPTFNPTRVIAVWLPAGQTTTRIRILFTNVGAVSDYVEVGAVIIGRYIEPVSTLVDGFTLSLQDPSVLMSSVAGQTEAQQRPQFHVASGVFERLEDTDRVFFAQMFAAVGRYKPFLFAIDPADPDEMLYGRIEDLSYQHVLQSIWDVPLTVVEER